MLQLLPRQRLSAAAKALLLVSIACSRSGDTGHDSVVIADTDSVCSGCALPPLETVGLPPPPPPDTARRLSGDVTAKDHNKSKKTV